MAEAKPKATTKPKKKVSPFTVSSIKKKTADSLAQDLLRCRSVESANKYFKRIATHRNADFVKSVKKKYEEQKDLQVLITT